MIVSPGAGVNAFLVSFAREKKTPPPDSIEGLLVAGFHAGAERR
jgi:hypothetical protein